VPAAKDGKLAEVDKTATDAALAELVKLGEEAVVGLVNMLTTAEKGGDGQARHALHALVIHAGSLKDDPRRVISEALASTLAGDCTPEVKAFVLRQLQLVGRKEVVPAVGKLLADETLGEDAVRTLVAIKAGATEQLRGALAGAKGRNLLVIAQALGTLKDTESAPTLRKVLEGEDSDLRQVAGWALANMADADSAALLSKRADTATGFERTKLTQACLLLAENLLAAGKKKEAAVIYGHLHESRTDDAEKHIRSAAAAGLAAIR